MPTRRVWLLDCVFAGATGLVGRLYERQSAGTAPYNERVVSRQTPNGPVVIPWEGIKPGDLLMISDWGEHGLMYQDYQRALGYPANTLLGNCRMQPITSDYFWGKPEHHEREKSDVYGCTCGHYGPALEHSVYCPAKISFYGAPPQWGMGYDNAVRVHEGVTYKWGGPGTWVPIWA